MRENKFRSLSLEDHLCLLLSRGQLVPTHEVQVRELLSLPVRWPKLLELVYAHETWPLVYRNLRELGFLSVPDAVRAELKCAYATTALKNQFAVDELTALVDRLSDARIPVVPLKGVYLANSLYGDPATRVSSDLDLLVLPGQLDRSLEVIRAAGYRDVFDDRFFRKLELRYGRHYSFVRDGTPYSTQVEVHWRLVQHSSDDGAAVDDLWAEAQPARCFGTSAYQLSPAWQFLYLCLHAADHSWRGLKWLTDVDQLCVSQPPEWGRVKQKADQFCLESVVRRTLATCSLLFGTPLPEAYASVYLRPEWRRSALALSPKPEQQTLSHLSLLARPWDRLRCLANVILVPKPADRNFVRLPAALSVLYYPLRAVRLIGKRL